ncbi:MAG: hypothetical protein NW237_00730 [Cyanobacteriota bacterium]|nr:hypothetical protein [Cyanobacteriota bacterium]
MRFLGMGLILLLLGGIPLSVAAQDLNQQLNAAVAEKRWPDAIDLVDQVIQQQPDRREPLRAYRSQLAALAEAGIPDNDSIDYVRKTSKIDVFEEWLRGSDIAKTEDAWSKFDEISNQANPEMTLEDVITIMGSAGTLIPADVDTPLFNLSDSSQPIPIRYAWTDNRGGILIIDTEGKRVVAQTRLSITLD